VTASRRMRLLLGFVLALHIVITASSVCIGETIRLRCLGTLFLYEGSAPQAKISDPTVTADLDGKLVHGLLGGPYRIAKVEQDAITMRTPFTFDDGAKG
jgi:hypothetical protein